MESNPSLWREALLVGAGGFLGSAARFLVSEGVARSAARTLPLGTLAVNALGCLAIGLLAGWVHARGGPSPELRAFVFLGVLGGFTTFSAFGNETVALVREGQAGLATMHVALHLVVGLGLAAAGFWWTGARA